MTVTSVDASDQADDLATVLTDSVKTVPGVKTLYATRPTLEQAVRTVVGVVTRERTDASLITVTRGERAIDIVICIGVGEHEAAPVVSRRVWGVIDGILVARNEIGVRNISVTVGSVL